jgi:hypothetical protein
MNETLPSKDDSVHFRFDLCSVWFRFFFTVWFGSTACSTSFTSFSSASVHFYFRFPFFSFNSVAVMLCSSRFEFTSDLVPFGVERFGSVMKWLMESELDLCCLSEETELLCCCDFELVMRMRKVLLEMIIHLVLNVFIVF